MMTSKIQTFFIDNSGIFASWVFHKAVDAIRSLHQCRFLKFWVLEPGNPPWGKFWHIWWDLPSCSYLFII